VGEGQYLSVPTEVCKQMAKLTPYFYSHNAREQAAFYVAALGGEILQQMAYGDAPGTEASMKDQIIHMAFIAAGVNFYMADVARDLSRSSSDLELTLEFATDAEARAAFESLSAGGTVVMALEPQFWGTLFGRLRDRFGVSWQITTTPKS